MIPVNHDISIERAVPGRIEQSYPLAQLARPKLTLEEWRVRCGRRRLAGANGLLLALDGANCVRGLCSYQVQPDRADGGAVEADLFAAAHPFGAQPFVTELLDELERIAATAGCRAVEFAPEDFHRWLRQSEARRDIALRPSGQLAR
jgi:hypothetical protein